MSARRLSPVRRPRAGVVMVERGAGAARVRRYVGRARAAVLGREGWLLFVPFCGGWRRCAVADLVEGFNDVG